MKAQRLRFFSPPILTAAACLYTLYPQLFQGSRRLWLLVPTAILVVVTVYIVPATSRRPARSEKFGDSSLSRTLFFVSLGLSLVATVGLAATRIPLVGIGLFGAQIVLAIAMLSSGGKVEKRF